MCIRIHRLRLHYINSYTVYLFTYMAADTQLGHLNTALCSHFGSLNIPDTHVYPVSSYNHRIAYTAAYRTSWSGLLWALSLVACNKKRLWTCMIDVIDK